MKFNICGLDGSDSYKHSHWGFYPDDLEVVHSYCEPRTGARFDETVFFGLQYLLQEYMVGEVVTREGIEQAATECAAHFGRNDVFNRQGWEYILEVHGGRLPVQISALPEGTVVPTGTPLFTISNTDPRVPWLTNYLETILMQMWGATTVASSSRKIRRLINTYLETTGDPAGLDVKLHDFGYRGVACPEAAALLGAGHLASGFLGTDTGRALRL
jgi:nicotinamide phosphoribosyltransferase